MNPNLKKAVSALERARKGMRDALRREQRRCPHRQVIHSNWRGSDWGSAFKARRLCLDCGLEEEAMNSGWGDNDSDFRRLKTKGFHKVVEPDALYQARLPEADVNGELTP